MEAFAPEVGIVLEAPIPKDVVLTTTAEGHYRTPYRFTYEDLVRKANQGNGLTGDEARALASLAATYKNTATRLDNSRRSMIRAVHERFNQVQVLCDMLERSGMDPMRYLCAFSERSRQMYWDFVGGKS